MIIYIVRGTGPLSPAKAGSCSGYLRYPRFRSLCSLHPGLNSAASFAGSLCSFIPISVTQTLRDAGGLAVGCLFILVSSGLAIFINAQSVANPPAAREQIATNLPSPADIQSLPAIPSRANFDSLAVEYDANTPYALPHVLFVI